jgi:hypothetical protein
MFASALAWHVKHVILLLLFSGVTSTIKWIFDLQNEMNNNNNNNNNNMNMKVDLAILWA